MRLEDVLALELPEWPAGTEYFTCDPDGEVRSSEDTGADFYPQRSVADEDRSDRCGHLRSKGTEVTETQWRAARSRIGK